MLAIVIPAGVLAGIVQASFFEWIFHRFWLHRPWLPDSCFTSHTLVHHQLCKHDDTFEVDHHDEEAHEALTFSWWGGPAIVLINATPWALAAGLLHAMGVQFPLLAMVLTIAATVTLYYLAYEGFHFLMHKPSIGWIERARWFRFLKDHHRLHHVHMHKNLNVILPLADLVLGTFVKGEPIPATTSPKAREVARRHSSFGRRLRDGSN